MAASLGPRALAGPTLVVEVGTGKVLHEENAGDPWFPASLTKMMTAYVVFNEIREGRLTLSSKITVSRYAAGQAPSKIGLPPDAQISVEDALRALIIRSANDIAMVLAEGVAGSEPAFVRLMNKRAEALGMTGTYFTNPNGLPDLRQVTTARDLGILARALIDHFPEHADLFKMQEFRLGKHRYRGHNGILRSFDGADGMKTGFICDSGYNLVASATRDGRQLVAIVLGAKSGAARTIEAKKLLEEGFSDAAGGNVIADRGQPPPAPRLDDIANDTLFAGDATDMKQEVCRLGKVRVSTWWTRQKNAVVLARGTTPVDVHRVLHRDLLAVRSVIFSGKGTIYREEGEGPYVAAISSLDPAQVDRVCGWLQDQSRECERLDPIPEAVVTAKLKAIARAAAAARAKRRAQRKARKARKRRARRKKKSK